MNPAELEIIMSESMRSQNADTLDFPEVDSDGDARLVLGASSSDEAEKLLEEKFARRVKRMTLRRQIRMEPDSRTDRPPGNRIGSALATEMVIALTQLRSHARTHATQTQPKSISRFGGGLTTDSHPQPPI